MPYPPLRSMEWDLPNTKRESEKVRELKRKVRQLKELNVSLLMKLRHNARQFDDVWFNDDHSIWFTHQCLGETLDTPLHGWTMHKKGWLYPSILCDRCGAHFLVRWKLELTYLEPGTGRPWKQMKKVNTQGGM